MKHIKVGDENNEGLQRYIGRIRGMTAKKTLDAYTLGWVIGGGAANQEKKPIKTEMSPKGTNMR